MEDESLQLNEGIQNIKKTQSALISLQTKLNQYVSKSRDTTAKRFKQPPASSFVMPSLYFDLSVKKESRKHPTTEATPQPQNTRENERLDADIQYYKTKLERVQFSSQSMSKIEQFYHKRTELLEEKVKQIEQKCIKTNRDKELLAKQNRRLNQQINKLRAQKNTKQSKMRIQTQTLIQKGKIAKQQKLKQLKQDIKRQKQIEEGLISQVQSYESSLKLMLELQKNLINAEILSRERKTRIYSAAPSTNLNKTRSKPHLHNKSQVNRHRQCYMVDTIQKSKSKSFK